MKQTCETFITTFGHDIQLSVATEELSELIKEISKFKRWEYFDHGDMPADYPGRKSIVDELSDVAIIAYQIGLIFNISGSEVQKVIDMKVERMKKFLDEYMRCES